MPQAVSSNADMQGVLCKLHFVPSSIFLPIHRWQLTCRPATKQNLGSHAAKICVPNIVDAVELGSDNATSTYFFAAVQKPGEKPEAAAIPPNVSFFAMPVVFPA